MPVERQRWVPVASFEAANAQLRRRVEVLDNAARFDIQTVSATGPLALAYPLTLVLVTTSGGNVTLTLPASQTVPGFRVDVKKLTAANTLTLDGAGSETIDGAATLAWTTQYQSYALIADGSVWHVVGA